MQDAKDSIREHEGYVSNLRVQVEADLRKLEHTLGKLVSVDDMQLNFKQMQDFLQVKFMQLEDVKEGLKDIAVF
jgi:hypothetical protein